ncbi:MAG: bis(5'-nucleosyl)-tetraphosphatase (symmetrical) YqeK [Clostridia bacterium]|nr:bis(5'-nucleosyl)-tetraphosphatase (symmetrical) YqeK [Clostridia bacterium]
MKKTEWTEQDTAVLAERVKPYLTEKRYVHTLAVANEAKKLGAVYLPKKIAKLQAAALLHDITKKADLKKQLQYCEEFGIIVKPDDLLSPSVFHAKTAEALAARDFSDLVDDEILAGVRWHTTGHADMTVFEAIIYLADYIEETRDFDDCVKVRSFFYDHIAKGTDPIKVLRDTMIYSFDCTITLLLEEGAVVDSDTICARNFYIAQKKDCSNKERE